MSDDSCRLEGEGAETQGKVCPSCHRALTEDTVICVNCGLDLRTGVKLATQAKTPHSKSHSPRSIEFRSRDRGRRFRVVLDRDPNGQLTLTLRTGLFGRKKHQLPNKGYYLVARHHEKRKFGCLLQFAATLFFAFFFLGGGALAALSGGGSAAAAAGLLTFFFTTLYWHFICAIRWHTYVLELRSKTARNIVLYRVQGRGRRGKDFQKIRQQVHEFTGLELISDD